jgi:hypothetical protein
MSFPGNRSLPGVDDHLVEPEVTRDEIVRGRHVIAMPALPPHADRHARLDYLIVASTSEGYVTSSDLLTRMGPNSNFATDTSVRRDGIDPATGQRYLEELAFEVVSEQSNRDIRERAEDLTARGVRRLIAVFVKRGEVREWSRERNDWVTLPIDGVIEDPVLARPVAVRALLEASVADDEVVAALDAKGNPKLNRIKADVRELGRVQGFEQGLEQGLAQGRGQGLARAIETVCKVLRIPFGSTERARLESLDASGLEALLAYLETEQRWPEPTKP